jgi:hypothetical protein
MSEKMAIGQIKRNHICYEPGETYIALDGVEFRWTIEQVEEFERMWDEGLSLEYIAHHFGRTCLETGLLLADRADKGYCKPRKNGIN